MGNIWSCKIGEADGLPEGADLPMRQAVQLAYYQLTGKHANFCFSGWGAKLTEKEREVVMEDEDRKKFIERVKGEIRRRSEYSCS